MHPNHQQGSSAVPDVFAPGLRVVFCGINPGFVSAAAGAHFANPRNDFWRLLHDAGFTPWVLAPEEQFEVVRFGIGLTNAAARTTRGSGDLRRRDFLGSAERLAALAEELRPRWLAFVGKEAYRGTFRERPELGEQARQLGVTRLFVLPSTSPANAAVPYAERAESPFVLQAAELALDGSASPVEVAESLGGLPARDCVGAVAGPGECSGMTPERRLPLHVEPILVG